jgi:mRNA interferase MazF
MMPEQGDIVLIPIPFTDLSSQKRRPVIVISNDTYNRKTTDIVVVAMTSNPAQIEYGLTITIRPGQGDTESSRPSARG